MASELVHVYRRAVDAEAEAERLREALRFYADESTYDVTTVIAWDNGAPLREPDCPIYDDRGEVARAALNDAG